MKHRFFKNRKTMILCSLAALLGLIGYAAIPKEGTSVSPALAEDSQNKQEKVIMDFSNEPENVIYLAGGCFWGIEHLMQSIPGVIDAKSGYANGNRAEDANYQTICTTDTGFRETVRVEYDPQQVSLDALLLAYFYVIDPTVVYLLDESHGMQRIEVRSRAGNSHLGHVFVNDPESPNGVRFCINSASLRFIPYAHMEAEGYGYLMDLVE